MKQIQLSNGGSTLVDDADFDWLNKYRWHGYKAKGKNNTYAHTRINGVRTQMHRLIMGCTKGDGKMIDHRDMNGLNNQRSNIRFTTNAENSQNRRASGKSKYLGVSIEVRKKSYIQKRTGLLYECNFATRYKASIRINKVLKNLGRFKTEEEAALAYNTAAKAHFGDDARLNDIPPTQ